MAVRSWHERFPDWLRARFTDSQRFFFLCSLAGAVSGLAAVAFNLGIHWLFDTLWHLHEVLGRVSFLALLVFAPALGGLLTGIVLAKIPSAAGSGIPQTKAAYYRDFGFIKLRDGLWRFVLGVVSVGSGMSLGREGPTVHICAAISSKIGQWFGLAKKRVQAMVPVGMGAGIAAAFNTPLAAITFVFEELLHDFSSKALGGILAAVVISAVVARVILGENPAFTVDLPEFPTSFWMLLSLPLGLLAAFLGHGFVGLLLVLRGRFRAQRWLPVWLKPAIGGLFVGITGVTIFALTSRHGIFSIGYGDLSAALNGAVETLTGGISEYTVGWVVPASIVVFALLFVGKYLATIVCYASGASGGLFAPVLFIGGMLGGLVGSLGQLGLGFGNEVVGAFALLGMGAFFAAVIRAPFTSFLIIFELTYNYALILPLMVGNAVAFVLAQKLRPVPVYNALLLQDKISLRRMPEYKGNQDWRNLPVSTIMTFEICTLKADEPIAEALAVCTERPHRAYPVLDAEERVVGVLLWDEIQAKARENPATPARECLYHSLVTVSPDTSIRDAANRLVLEDVDLAPVVSAKDPGKLLGIVTIHDIARQQNAIEGAIGR